MIYTGFNIEIFSTGQDQYALSCTKLDAVVCVDTYMNSTRPDWEIGDWQDSGWDFFSPRHDEAQPIAAAASDTHERVSAYAWQVECIGGQTVFYAQVTDGDDTEHCIGMGHEEVVNWMNRMAE